VGVTVSLDNPAFPDGDLLGIPYLGAVPNGGSLEVDDEQEAVFEQAYGMSVKDYLKNDPNFSVAGAKSSSKSSKGGES